MKIKKEFIILGIIIGGLLLYISQRSTDKITYQLPDIPAVAKKEITAIEVSKDETPIVLKKKDDKWYFDPQGYLADSNKVRGMLSGIEQLTLAALVSESKNYNLYDLDDQNKIQIKAWQVNLVRVRSTGKIYPVWAIHLNGYLLYKARI